MKRTWIFIALFFAAIAFVPNANAATILSFEEVAVEAQAANNSVQVTVILQNAAEELIFSYEELLNFYNDGLVTIEAVSETTSRVTVMAADGNPLVGIIIDNF